MNKKNLKIFLLLSILLTLVGLQLDLSESKSYDDESSTPSISNLSRTFWENNGTLIYNGSGLSTYSPEMCSDGVGGAILTWVEDRDGDLNIYAQRISDTGEKQWGENGTAVCTAPYTQAYPRIVSDGYGGAIIAWTDSRHNFGFAKDIYATRIDFNGQLYSGWTTNGTLICNETNDQTSMRMISDGFDGAIMVWRDMRIDPDRDLYAQRIDDTGTTLWDDNGTAICTDEDTQIWHDSVSDGLGGAIITWHDDRNGGFNDDIFVQYINSTGDIKWDSDGINICSASEDQSVPKICSDDSGGAIITWQDKRTSSSTDWDIYAQRVNSTGDELWKPNGIVICNETEDQGGPRICGDGSGGAIITWGDERDYPDRDIYAQRIDSTGTTLWDDNGTAICTQEDLQGTGNIISDGSGGAFICWADQRNGNYDIYAQIINSNGDILWNENGTAICNEAGNQRYHNFCTDGSEGAIIVWVDEMGTNDDIYGQKLRNDRPPTSNHPGTVITSATGSETIDWVLADDYSGGQYRVWANNSLGNYYVRENWAPWVSGIPFSISINRTAPGDYNYTIEFYDDQGQIETDTVIVTVTDAIPTSNHPDPITTNAGGSETIGWILYDEFGEGEYRVLANNTLGNNYVWVDWTAWTNETSLAVPINRSAPGDFEYTIEFDDDHNQLGVPDTVIVTLTDAIPTSNHPADFNVDQDDSRNIAWTLSDDFGGGQYRVLVDGTAGSWTAWTSGVQINHPVDTSTVGVFNYTIQYYDLYGLYGAPDTVIVTVEEPTPTDGDGEEPGIPGYELFFVLMVSAIIIVFFIRKKRYKIIKEN